MVLNRLELEITESLLLSDTDANLATLHRLKAAGIRISMDDFGTGYSFAGQLMRSFPFDKIKIDQSFIKDLETNPASAAIVRAVLSLGNSLGIGTIAEGVETSEQMLRLKYEGCTQIQGFDYSKAQPAAGVAAMLAEHIRDPKKQISTIVEEAANQAVPPEMAMRSPSGPQSPSHEMPIGGNIRGRPASSHREMIVPTERTGYRSVR